MATQKLTVWVNRLYHPETGNVTYAANEYPFHGENWMPVKSVEIEFEEPDASEITLQARADLIRQLEDTKTKSAAAIAELQVQLLRLTK